MNRHRNDNSQQLQQLQNRRTLMNSLATRPHSYNPNINDIHEDELADGRNVILGMITQIKEVRDQCTQANNRRKKTSLTFCLLVDLCKQRQRSRATLLSYLAFYRLG